MDEASDILTRYVDAKGTVDAKGAALTTFDRLGLAGVAESLGLMWISLRERARALRAGPHDPDPNPPARAALAQSLGGDEYVEEFLTSADPFLGPPGPDGEPNPEDTPAQESVAWTLAEFLIIRGCQAAAYQMLRATGAGPAPSSLLEATPSPPPPPALPLPWPAPSLPPPPATDEDISAFLSLFAGRASGYAEEIQTDDGRRVLLYMDAPLDAVAVRRHLGAERTLAIYPCREEATVTACVVDVDIGKRSLLLHPPGSPDFDRLLQAARADALALASALRVHGVPSYVEWTGRRGYHVWVFLEEPVPVGAARQALQALLGAAGNPPDGVTREMLPKEAGAGAGQRGGAVKLPLGVHVQTGDRSSFLDDSGRPVTSPWDHVRAVVRVPASAFLRLVEDCRPPEGPRLPKPRRLQSGTVPAIVATLPDGPVKQVVAGCAAVAHLVEKARHTGYLNHQERVTLLLVLGHVGAEGNRRRHHPQVHAQDVWQACELPPAERAPPRGCGRRSLRLPFPSDQANVPLAGASRRGRQGGGRGSGRGSRPVRGGGRDRRGRPCGPSTDPTRPPGQAALRIGRPRDRPAAMPGPGRRASQDRRGRPRPRPSRHHHNGE